MKYGKVHRVRSCTVQRLGEAAGLSGPKLALKALAIGEVVIHFAENHRLT
jgi:hypothetical protein